MMEEAGAMLSCRHGFTPEEMLDYRTFIMGRFRNEHIIDSCERVSREPLRKLASHDRIIAAMNYAHGFGIETPAYYKGIAELLHYSNPNDAQSLEMQQLIGTLGVRKALESISDIPAESREATLVEAEYNKIAGQIPNPV